jgi:hypothetical protein
MYGTNLRDAFVENVTKVQKSTHPSEHAFPAIRGKS